jgi:hypothetical protein
MVQEGLNWRNNSSTSKQEKEWLKPYADKKEWGYH